MGTKVEALKHVAEKGKPGEPITKLAKILVAMLPTEFDLTGEDPDDFADALLDLDEFKDVVKLANESANELKDQINSALYDLMVSKERTKFDKRGQLFYLTSQNYVQADKEQGGTKNPRLIEWLESNGLGDLAARNVNANALRGAVNTWIEQHQLETEDFEEAEVMELFNDAIEFEQYEGEDGSTVTVEQQVAWRDYQRQQYLAQRDEDEFVDDEGNQVDPVEFISDVVTRKLELLEMVKITQKPTVGMKKA